jgi:cytochrome P450
VTAPTATAADASASSEARPDAGPRHARPTPLRPRGSRGHPVLGLSLELRKDILGTMLDQWRRHGDVVGLRSPFRGVPDVLLAHPDAVKQVLQEQHRSFVHPPRQRRTFSDVVGQGLVASEGDYWRRQRRLSAPAFKRDAVLAYDATTVDSVDDMLRRWQPALTTGSGVDMRVEMMRVTLDVLARSMFGVDWRNQLEDLGVHVTHLLERTFQRMLSPVGTPVWLPTSMNRRFRRSRSGADDVVVSLIAAHRNGSVQGSGLLGRLIDARDEQGGDGMTDAQLRDEVMSMLIAGHETVSTALTWTCYLLARHGEAQSRVTDEVDRVCGGRPPTAADLPHLDYTRRVVMEAMRLYPPLWIMGRSPVEDVEVSGHLLTKGSVVLLSQYVTHRHPAFWDDPEAFEPDRFLPEAARERHRYAYFPFGGGPRKCIGESFGLMEMPLVIARMLQECRLELMPGHQAVVPAPGISLRPANGLMMVVRPRSRGSRA